jgi:hypothetical protein
MQIYHINNILANKVLFFNAKRSPLEALEKAIFLSEM